jgi:hypothetical protein
MGICYRLDHELDLRPVIICDQCNLEIQGSGDVLFAATDGGSFKTGTYFPASFVHRGCADEYRFVHRTWQRIDISTWLLILKMNYLIPKETENAITNLMNAAAAKRGDRGTREPCLTKS